MSRKRALDELTSLWTKRLYVEYTNILHCYGLDRDMRPTAITIESQKPYGVWRSDTRTIAIADHLIRDYPWSVVVEVLKHEMAHQYVHEVLGECEQGPHGGAFKLACGKLGVPAWAASASGALPDTLGESATQQLSDEEERLLRRAEKLLALAGSSNEHEAQLAMERAQDLFARHNLDALRSRKGAAMTSRIIRLHRQKIFNYEKLIASLLAEHFFVYVVLCNDYRAQDCVEYRALDVMGAPENVAMAEYVFHFLRRAADDLWLAHYRRDPDAHKPSFQRGVIGGFREKLRLAASTGRVVAESGLDQATAMALIATGKALIEETIGRERYPKTRRRASRGGRFHRGSFNAGQADGKKIVLHKGVDGGGRNEGRLLPGKT